MIGLIFQFAGDTIEVRIRDNDVYFRTSQSPGFAPIDGLKLSKSGVIKEFPDLEDNIEWRNISIQRFKNKMKELKTEKERAENIIQDLNKFGYNLLFVQREGFRPQKTL